jgi:hypothetical protein
MVHQPVQPQTESTKDKLVIAAVNLAVATVLAVALIEALRLIAHIVVWMGIY